MKDKDSRKIFESYEGATQLRQAQIARGRASDASSGDTGYNHTGGMGETLPPPDGSHDRDQTVKNLVRQKHGWDIDKSPDGDWYRFDAGEARPLTGDEHWDVMRIEDPEKEAEYKQKQNPGHEVEGDMFN